MASVQSRNCELLLTLTFRLAATSLKTSETTKYRKNSADDVCGFRKPQVGSSHFWGLCSSLQDKNSIGFPGCP